MINILARDILLNALIVFMALVVILLLLVNPPTDGEKSDDPPGNLTIMIVWPEGPTDIDLWIRSPGEPRAVGYSNKSGRNVSLLRDDLGTANDTIPLNAEHAYVRGIVPGEYILNAHYYRGSEFPITVHLEIRMNDGGSSKVLLTTTAQLTKQGQEITLVKFRLKPDGTVDKNSVHSVFTPLRNVR